MTKVRNLVGKTVGNVEVLASKYVDGRREFLCRCVCGERVVISSSRIYSKTAKPSCGCRKRDEELELFRRRKSESAKRRCTPEWRMRMSAQSKKCYFDENQIAPLYASGLSQKQVGEKLGVGSESDIFCNEASRNTDAYTEAYLEAWRVD